MTGRQRRWYGWGYADTTYYLDHRPGAWPYLKAQLGLDEHVHTPPVDPASMSLRPSRLSGPALAALRAAVGGAGVRTDDEARLAHSLGHSYRDLTALRTGQVSNPTDAVVAPASEDDVTEVLAVAAAHHLAVVPYGGGTSVVGGVEPRGPRAAVTLSLARLIRALAIDPVSHTVTAQAGIFGPDLEAAVNAQGFTVAHSPQSFEFSTLGGWIAARGAGQTSTSPALVLCHLSHAYTDGAALYFTFLARAEAGGEAAQWEAIRKAALDCLVGLGATLTHHHGLGADTAPWLTQEAGPAGLAALRAVKQALDPVGVMNPGVLLSQG